MRITKKDGHIQGLRQWGETAKDGDYDILPHKPKKSYEQLKLYWLLLTLVERETGNNKDHLHDHMKMNFLARRSTVRLGGKRKSKKIPGSTKGLKRDEFSYFYSQVELFFGNLGYHLPPSDSPEWRALVASCPEFYS